MARTFSAAPKRIRKGSSMNTREMQHFASFVAVLILAFTGVRVVLAEPASRDAGQARTVVLNPYDTVDWNTAQKHKAAVHLHTLQSDGYYMPDEVIKAYRNAGFTVLSITDHDWDRPNAQVRWNHVPAEKASPYPKNPTPPDFHGNPTWPWTDYGSSSPQALGMIGIQGNELTYRHHINSFYNDYGLSYDRAKLPGFPRPPIKGIVDDNGVEIWEDDELAAIARKGGLAIINHPGIPDSTSWWERKPLDWFVERFENHPADCLIGIEVTNGPRLEAYQQALWDQLLARSMPDRPIWGLGTDDMHNLAQATQAFTVLLLEEATDANVRSALENGKFIFCSSTEGISYLETPAVTGVFPLIEDIVVDQVAHSITIKATHCDTIRWISSPKSLEPTGDYRTSDNPWPAGQVVHTSATLNYRDTPNLGPYVRAELRRTEGKHTYRTFTNPFGIAE
jgi:hypothetical protein